jgi:hypothetical protein
MTYAIRHDSINCAYHVYDEGTGRSVAAYLHDGAHLQAEALRRARDHLKNLNEEK